MPNQTKIKSISIENVRGISSSRFIFDTPEMIGNKFHILVAPNGFGKSSFAGAFSSLKPRSLKISPSLLHKEDEKNKPKIEIACSINGLEKTLIADESKNDISKIFSVAVINSRLKPHAKAKVAFQQFAKATASLIIEPITLVEKIPNNPQKNISTEDYKDKFNKARKILPNIKPLLDNDLFLRDFLNLECIQKFKQKTVWKKIDPIILAISNYDGTAKEILDLVSQNLLSSLQDIPELELISNLLKDYSSFNEVERYLVAYQFAAAYKDNSITLNEYLQRYSYLSAKKRCKELLQSVNSNPSWISITVKETKGKLIAELPEATKMSNGQRDLFSFVAQLMKAEFSLSGSHAILIIDEVFDYLDECNLLAAQFYASKFIDKFKSNGAEIFPLFLTHLNPEVFKHSALGLGKKDTRKVHLLDKASDTSRTKGIAAMVKNRDEDSLKPYIGKYFFHYHPENSNQEELFEKKGLKKSWGQSHNFYKYTFEEFKKYRAGSLDCDFVAACVAARVAIEKQAYDQIDAANQQRFIEDFNQGTSDKLSFVEQLGVEVPESHRLLGLLYNDILHHKDHFDYISSIVSKMKNPAIRGMMQEIPINPLFQ